MKIIRKIIESRFMYGLLSRFQWYRKLHGGRFELWFIGMCGSAFWLLIDSKTADNHRQPCSEGPRMAREDWSCR